MIVEIKKKTLMLLFSRCALIARLSTNNLRNVFTWKYQIGITTLLSLSKSIQCIGAYL